MREWVCRPGLAQRRGSMAKIAANRSGCLGVEMATAATTGSTCRRGYHWIDSDQPPHRPGSLVSCYGLFAKADTIRDNLSFVASVVLAQAYSIVQYQVARVVSKGGGKLGFGVA